MSHITRNLHIRLSKVTASDIRLVLFVLTLGMFIIGAGAPDAGGGFYH